MTDDRIDFGPIDPRQDPERFERIVGSIMERAASELSARRAGRGVLEAISLWWKPTLAAAALAGLLYLGVAAGLRPEEEVGGQVGIAEAIGMPTTVADWVRSDEPPTTEELLLTLEVAR